jgi:hypothetical protein
MREDQERGIEGRGTGTLARRAITRNLPGQRKRGAGDNGSVIALRDDQATDRLPRFFSGCRWAALRIA